MAGIKNFAKTCSNRQRNFVALSPPTHFLFQGHSTLLRGINRDFSLPHFLSHPFNGTDSVAIYHLARTSSSPSFKFFFFLSFFTQERDSVTSLLFLSRSNKKKHSVNTRSIMLSSTENLYPVVHDLTDMEYGNNSSGMCCCDEVLGGFTVKDLAIPILTPRSLPVTPPSSPPAFESHKHASTPIDASQSRMSTTKGTMPSTNSETRSRRGRSIPTLPRSSSNSGRFGKRSFEHYRSSSNHSTMASSTSLTEETTSSTDDTYGFENFNRDEVMTDANAFDSIFVLTRQVRTFSTMLDTS